jgi:formyltetrahydrofolate-dependent phosphoribosylglycinamide formyltransferase
MTRLVRARLAILASGGGSNLQAILDHLRHLGTASPAEVAVVISDRAAAGALDRARAAGILAVHLPASESHTLAALLEAQDITHIALAGYLRLIPAEVIAAFAGRIVNVHPALLPAFGGPGMYGRHVHEAVLRAGVRVSGPTVHFVDTRYDEGAIIAQWPVPVEADDTPTTLAARVLAAEHQLYPRVVAALCAGTITLEADGTVRGAEELTSQRPIPGAPPLS